MDPELPALPGQSSPAGPHADGGRGLLILDTVADRWGGCMIGERPHGPCGKTLWFELALPARPPAECPASSSAPA
ncbi:hypothetical protein [Streptomyces sp. G45]|uniref:hypothetical protein n=1 Tax=Streptomyces sp. G45 TaxID=3406627 RepID=UPI003C150E71